jgi:GT2 family glycosyltransferase
MVRRTGLDNLAAVSEVGHSTRPPVDVVVPFAGSASQLDAVCERLGALELRPGDSLLVVDNSPSARSLNGSKRAVSVLTAAERRSPGFARNRGAAEGHSGWIVFIDADATPHPDLLDRFFDPPPGARTALLGGGVIDEPVAANAPVAARYAYLRGSMSQERTFSFGQWGYPKSANIACRREAFEALGGFREDIRAAEDADLTYRLRAAGWEIERREAAAVVHSSRPTLAGLIKQQLQWGAGGAWLERQYPGSVPLASSSGLLRWALRETTKGFARIRLGDRDALIYAVLRPLEGLAWELGRLLPNERRER